MALEGTTESADAVAGLLDARASACSEIVLLHVHPLDALPLFEDQPVHEHETWTREFVTRRSPPAARECRFELRVGTPGERLVELAEEAAADLIALSWSRSLAPGHAAVSVRADCCETGR